MTRTSLRSSQWAAGEAGDEEEEEAGDEVGVAEEVDPWVRPASMGWVRVYRLSILELSESSTKFCEMPSLLLRTGKQLHTESTLIMQEHRQSLLDPDHHGAVCV